MEKELRRNQSIVKLSGIATLVFELWSIVKFAAYCLYDPEKIQSLIDSNIDGYTVAIAGLLIIIMILIDMGFRVFVAINAIRVSRGEKRGIAYIVVTIIIVAITLLTAIDLLSPGNAEWDDIIMQIVVDISSIIIEMDLIVAGMRIRSIEKEMEG